MTKTVRAAVTKAAVDKLEPGQAIRCTKLPGFGARRYNGTPSYFVQTRLANGQLKWITLGKHGVLTAEEARRKARRVLVDTSEGVDLNATKRQKRESPTVQEVVALFHDIHGPKLKPSTQYTYEILFRVHVVPAIGSKKIEAVKKADVTKLHSSMKDKPRSANHALAALSSLMTFAQDQELRDQNTNPCFGVRRFKEAKRERYLSVRELNRLGVALRTVQKWQLVSQYTVAAIQLYILTGARKSEILTMRWEYVDLDHRVLRLPESKTGEKIIRLNPLAIEIINSLEKVNGNPFVIVGQRKGKHLIGIQKQWQMIRRRARLPDVRLHDLRHSFGAFVASRGGSLHQLGRLLGHSNPHTTARYAHLFEDPLADLVDETGSQMGAAIGLEGG